MTEKRFTSQDVYNGINEFHQFYDNHKRISNEEVVELLNALHEENEQLRKEIENGIESFKRIQRCHTLTLVEENEQLKQENKKLKEDLEHCANQFTNDGKNVLLSLR